MALNILALGDAHFTVSNIKEMNVYLEKLTKFLDENIDKIDVIVNLGDTLDQHERIHITPLNQAIAYMKLLTSYNKPTYMIVGNHDAQSNSIYLSSDHWLNCLKGWDNLKIIETVVIDTIKDYKITFCPYVYDGKFLEALDTRKGEWEDSSAIFSHVTIRGASMGNMIAKDADTWDPTNPMLISGHIHLKQKLADNMYYTGSILQVSCDEKPDKSIAVLKIDKQEVTIHEIDLKLPKKIILYEEIKNIDDIIINEDPLIKYSLYLSGSYEEFNSFRKTSRYKELINNPSLGKRIRFKSTTEQKNNRIVEINTLKNTKQKHFIDILGDLVRKENDKLLESFMGHLLDDQLEDLSVSCSTTTTVQYPTETD